MVQLCIHFDMLYVYYYFSTFSFYVKDNFINKSLGINQILRLHKYKAEESLQSICNLNYEKHI